MHSISIWLSKPYLKTKSMERGNIARAERNVLAKHLKDKEGITNEYALATFLIKKGAHPRGKDREVSEEYESQKSKIKRKK